LPPWWRQAWRKPPIACRRCSRRWSTCRRLSHLRRDRRRAALRLNQRLLVTAGIPPFIATLGMMVSARGLAQYYTQGNPSASCPTALRRLARGRCR
jgi:hypothetical protein